MNAMNLIFRIYSCIKKCTLHHSRLLVYVTQGNKEQYLPCMSSLRLYFSATKPYFHICVMHLSLCLSLSLSVYSMGEGHGNRVPLLFYQESKLPEPTEAQSALLITGLMRWGCHTVFPPICWSLIICRGLLSI